MRAAILVRIWCLLLLCDTALCNCFMPFCLCLNDFKFLNCANQSLSTIPVIDENATTFVEHLNLSQNYLSKVSTNDFKSYTRLRTLDLSGNSPLRIENNGLNGSSNLQILRLRSCGLSSVPPLSYFGRLSHLSLSNNTIRYISNGDFRPVQRTLRFLDLSHNRLANFSRDLFSFTSLKTLNISHNEFASLKRHNFRNLSQLEALDLTRNRIRRIPKDLFSPLTLLKELDMSRNRIRHLEGLSFKGLRNLQTLTLQRNGLTSMADGTFWDMPSLSSLILNNNRLTSVDGGWLYGLQKLTFLNLSRNALLRIDPEGWQFCTRLQILDLSYNRLKSLSSREFCHLRQLLHLNLRGNEMLMILANAFEALSELEQLDLSENLLADVLVSGLQVFLPLRKLTLLRLASNHIRVLPSGVFDGLRSLTSLDLNDNPLMVFSANALPSPQSLSFIILNTTSLLCDCQLVWLIETRENGQSLEINGVAECRQGANVGKFLLVELPANASCGAWPRPLIVSHPKSVTGLHGRNASFECRARCQDNSVDCYMTIHWRKNNFLLYPEPDAGINIDLEVIDSNVWISRLTMEAIDDEESGLYQCQITNELTSILSEKAQLVVYVPPTLVKRPVDSAVKVGGTMRLECHANGIPPPILSWKKDGAGDDFPAARERRMHVMPTEDVFFITDVKPQDAGVYTCIAKSQAGEDRAQVRLQVYGFDDDDEERGFSEMPEISVRTGAVAVLECGNAPPAISAVEDAVEDARPQQVQSQELLWQHNGHGMTSSSRSYQTANGWVWIIKDVVMSDQGLYVCRYKNGKGVVKERSWRLIVQASTDPAAKIGPPILPRPPLPPFRVGQADVEKRYEDKGILDRPKSATPIPTAAGILDPTSTPAILVMVIVACVLLTSCVWVIVIVWRRRRASSSGVAAVVVTLCENGHPTYQHSEKSQAQRDSSLPTNDPVS